MSRWISAEDDLPEDGEWVLAEFPDLPWGVNDDNEWRHKCVVVKFMRGITPAEREAMDDGNERKRSICPCDVHGNNEVPYCWDAFGPHSFFGQEAARWMRITRGEEEE